jgi:CrcB protein
MFLNFLLAGIGGMLGSAARYGIALAVAKYLSTGMPSGTLIVNVAGSFVIGVIFAATESHNPLSAESRIFLATGFCGGFTTFSALMLEMYTMLRNGEIFWAASYLGLSVVLGFAALGSGMYAARLIFRS